MTPKRRTTAVPEEHEQRSRVVLTVTWMATTLAIALFVPDIGKVIELIGGISAFFIFIFPGKSERREGQVTGARSITVGRGLRWWVDHAGPALGVQGCACGRSCGSERCRGGMAELLRWQQGCAWCA